MIKSNSPNKPLFCLRRTENFIHIFGEKEGGFPLILPSFNIPNELLRSHHLLLVVGKETAGFSHSPAVSFQKCDLIGIMRNFCLRKNLNHRP